MARDGSVSSGCAIAIDDSTASGAPCPPPRVTATTRPPDAGPRPTVRPGAGGGAPTGRSLALTGTSSAELAGLAGVALVAGAVLVGMSRRRPEES